MVDPVAVLKAYLRSHGERPSAFASRAGINVSTFFHVLSGRRTPGRDTALAIDAATEGKVPAPAWGRRKKSRRAEAA